MRLTWPEPGFGLERMDTVYLHDTRSREMRPLPEPVDGRFGLYVCGPTVYGPAHIGNFLTFIRFDSFYRLLKLAGYHPYYVRNITDVDDKTIKGSMEAGEDLRTFTDRWTERFHEDCAGLNLIEPDVEPRATEHIGEQIELIQSLMDGGQAYAGGDGSIYFRVAAFADYGKLSHFDMSALQGQSSNSAGTANLADEYERDCVSDFALWKSRKPEDGAVFWESPWGEGRPGWHLECSAMSLKYLGNNIHLHGGGEDLCFPHHENEIAQSEAATGQPFVQHWMHCVHLLVEGRKMSKSFGNFTLLDDLKQRGYHPMEIRLALLGGHYRQQFNFTDSGVKAARSGLAKIEQGVQDLLERAGMSRDEWGKIVSDPSLPKEWGILKPAWEAVRRDFNTPALLGSLQKGLRKLRAAGEGPDATRESLAALSALIYVTGLRLFSREEASAEVRIPDHIQALAEARKAAKKARDFSEADRLRDALSAEGWQITDTPQGYELKEST
jgi:cysteinyl-tRNA synthetase